MACWRAWASRRHRDGAGYSAFGGVLADALTDLLQGIVLALCRRDRWWSSPGWRGRPRLSGLSPRTGHGAAPGETTVEVLNRWAIPILGSITAQELICRIVACRSPQVAQRAAWMASLTYLSIGVLPVALGLMATQVNLNVADAEHVLPELAATHVPTFGYVLFVGVLVAPPVHRGKLPAGGSDR